MSDPPLIQLAPIDPGRLTSRRRPPNDRDALSGPNIRDLPSASRPREDQEGDLGYGPAAWEDVKNLVASRDLVGVQPGMMLYAGSQLVLRSCTAPQVRVLLLLHIVFTSSASGSSSDSAQTVDVGERRCLLLVWSFGCGILGLVPRQISGDGAHGIDG